MVYNKDTDELITGGVGELLRWTLNGVEVTNVRLQRYTGYHGNLLLSYLFSAPKPILDVLMTNNGEIKCYILLL